LYKRLAEMLKGTVTAAT